MSLSALTRVVRCLLLAFVCPSPLCLAQGSDEGNASVGRLLVPTVRIESGYARHFDERCSATLVAERPARESWLVLSAWHCLEDYRDLSRPIVFEHSSGQRRNAMLLASGGGMYSDWALLRLSAPMQNPALLASSTAAPALLNYGAALHLSGYPHNSSRKPPQRGERQTCAVTGFSDRDLRTDCTLTKGASGGAVFEAASPGRYLGVISRGDGETQSIFVPVARFDARIKPFLASLPPPRS